MVQVDIEYVGGLRCRAVHGPSNIELCTDAPIDNMGRGESYSPTDLVATALGTCILTILGILADRHKEDVRGSRVRVGKEMTDVGPRRIARLPVTLILTGTHPDDFQKRVEKAVFSCPVALSLHPDIRIPMEIHWKDQPVRQLSIS